MVENDQSLFKKQIQFTLKLVVTKILGFTLIMPQL